MTAKHQISRHLLPLCLSPLLVALCMASASAAPGTRDVALHGPNGDGGGDCSTAAATPADTAQAATDTRATKPAKKAPATRIKAIVPVRSGGDDAGVHAPRWHSFLPGMFR